MTKFYGKLECTGRNRKMGRDRAAEGKCKKRLGIIIRYSLNTHFELSLFLFKAKIIFLNSPHQFFFNSTIIKCPWEVVTFCTRHITFVRLTFFFVFGFAFQFPKTNKMIHFPQNRKCDLSPLLRISGRAFSFHLHSLLVRIVFIFIAKLRLSFIQKSL